MPSMPPSPDRPAALPASFCDPQRQDCVEQREVLAMTTTKTEVKGGHTRGQNNRSPMFAKRYGTLTCFSSNARITWSPGRTS